jgi:hypothetical protein
MSFCDQMEVHFIIYYNFFLTIYQTKKKLKVLAFLKLNYSEKCIKIDCI